MSAHYLVRSSFVNHGALGNPKYQVLPDISATPNISGKPKHRVYFKYPIYLEIPDGKYGNQKW